MRDPATLPPLPHVLRVKDEHRDSPVFLNDRQDKAWTLHGTQKLFKKVSRALKWTRKSCPIDSFQYSTSPDFTLYSFCIVLPSGVASLKAVSYHAHSRRALTRLFCPLCLFDPDKE